MSTRRPVPSGTYKLFNDRRDLGFRGIVDGELEPVHIQLVWHAPDGLVAAHHAVADPEDHRAATPVRHTDGHLRGHPSHRPRIHPRDVLEVEILRLNVSGRALVQPRQQRLHLVPRSRHRGFSPRRAAATAVSRAARLAASV